MIKNYNIKSNKKTLKKTINNITRIIINLKMLKKELTNNIDYILKYRVKFFSKRILSRKYVIRTILIILNIRFKRFINL